MGLSDNIRKGYQNVRVVMKVKSDAPAEKLAEFTKRSPVFDIVSNPVPVSVEIQKK